MRSVRLGKGGGRLAHYHGDLGTFTPSLAIMTGRDKLRQDMAGLGRTGQGISSVCPSRLCFDGVGRPKQASSTSYPPPNHSSSFTPCTKV